MKLLLIPCAATEWRAKRRLLGRADLPPAGDGPAYCREMAPQITEVPSRLLHGPDELAAQSARWLARALKVSQRTSADLVEVDLGLWTGLTETELATRFVSACRQIDEDPFTVTPPGGENFAEAAQRLRVCVLRAARRANGRPLGLVLRPLSLGLMLRLLGRDEPLRELMWETRPQLFEIAPDGFAALSIERSPAPEPPGRT